MRTQELRLVDPTFTHEQLRERVIVYIGSEKESKHEFLLTDVTADIRFNATGCILSSGRGTLVRVH
jgi:hypothetical protein